MDATINEEFARQKMEKSAQEDVAKIYKTVNGAAVGCLVANKTPDGLLEKKYKVIVRYATDSSGNAWAIEKQSIKHLKHLKK